MNWHDKVDPFEDGPTGYNAFLEFWKEGVGLELNESWLTDFERKKGGFPLWGLELKETVVDKIWV